MPDKWMTVAAAAATLNVHPRTIERRIASNKIESRRTDEDSFRS
jgi:excisionase family DNA binding protein